MPAQLQSLFSQIDPLSALAGLVPGVLFTCILFIILAAGLRRRLLMAVMERGSLESENRRLSEIVERLRLERDGLREDNYSLGRDNASLNAGRLGLEQQLQERELVLEAVQKQLEQRFEMLAGEILTEKGMLIHRQNESAMQLLLKPLHRQLQEFKLRVDDVYDRESRDRLNVLNEVKNLSRLNRQLSNDAVNLTEALQGKSKLQGQWGEMVLEKLLEDAGLRKGIEFEPQAGRTTEQGGRLQPDVLVHLPGNKQVIIDSKVSLKAFTLAHGEADRKLRAQHTQRHLESVKKHITSLSNKKYHQLIGVDSVDFVLLFIPVEAAFQLAIETDQNLLTTAVRRQVVLCSPSSLLAILRTIHYLWRLDEQHRNGLIIAKQAGNLYDKFVGFIESFEEVGMRLNQAGQAWELAHKRLSTGRGNLVTRAEQLKELGVQTDRNLTEVVTTRSTAN